jgi:hypothetical protein
MMRQVKKQLLQLKPPQKSLARKNLRVLARIAQHRAEPNLRNPQTTANLTTNLRSQAVRTRGLTNGCKQEITSRMNQIGLISLLGLLQSLDGLCLLHLPLDLVLALSFGFCWGWAVFCYCSLCTTASAEDATQPITTQVSEEFLNVRPAEPSAL